MPSATVNSQTTDPLFSNANSDDFTLQASSPAEDNGTSDVSSTVTTDYDDKTWTGTYEIGAHMYGAAAASTPQQSGVNFSGASFGN